MRLGLGVAGDDRAAAFYICAGTEGLILRGAACETLAAEAEA